MSRSGVSMLKKPCPLKTLCYLPGLLISIVLLFPCTILARDYENDAEFLHVVSPGESLSKIARLYLPLTEAYTVKDLIQKIKERNNLTGTMIRPNQQLLIPSVRSTPLISKTIPKDRGFEAKGIYLNRYSAGCRKMNRLLDRLIALGGNTVILDGKDMSGKLSYPSRVTLAREIEASANPIIANPPELFHYLHEKELHVVIRLVLFYDPLLAVKRPDLAVRSASTGEPWLENGKRAWVDPSHPTVQRYNLDIARELAEMGVDEIQFDYIRFPAMGDTRDAIYYFEDSFEEQEISKSQVITSFLAQAREELAPYKLLLSVDVFGVMGWEHAEDIQTTGQKIGDLAGYCDVMSPMIYPSHFYGAFQNIANPGDQPSIVVSETCRKFSALLEGKDVTLRPWIQAFPFGTSRFGENYILEELRALSESKARGWLFWSAGNAYDVAWKALAKWNTSALEGKTAKAQMSRLGEPLIE
ncbi:MAG: putative glycoside hydrolase [Thermodesulfobacteriota bacterium]